MIIVLLYHLTIRFHANAAKKAIPKSHHCAHIVCNISTLNPGYDTLWVWDLGKKKGADTRTKNSLTKR